MFTQAKWDQLDKDTKKITVNKIDFIKPTDDEPLNLDCPKCKIMISTIEDCEYLRSHSMCEQCFKNNY